MNVRTIRNLLGAALIALGVAGAYFALFLLTGEATVGVISGVIPLMLLQVQALIISATLFLAGLIIVCTGRPKA